MIDITDIQRLVVHPGEVLVVRVPDSTTEVECAKILEGFRYALPNVHVFVASSDVEFSVIAEQDLAHE